MRRRKLSLSAGLLMLCLGCAAGVPARVLAAEVIHVSLGIGDDDPIEIEMMRRLHNLQLVFALKGSGSYLADVRVTLHGAGGETVLVARSPGPLFFATLRPGTYRIDVEYHGKLLSRTTSIPRSGRRDLYFYWESAANDL